MVSMSVKKNSIKGGDIITALFQKYLRESLKTALFTKYLSLFKKHKQLNCFK